MKKNFLSVVVAIFILSSSCSASDPEPLPPINEQSNNQTDELSIKSILRDLSIDAVELGASALIVGALATIVHEWGHVAAASTVFAMVNKPQVHIGTTNPEQDASLLWFSIGNTHFYKKFPWFTGHSQSPYAFADQDPWLREKRMFHTAAGGMSAALFLYNALTSIMAYLSYCDDKALGEIIDTSCRRALSPFLSILQTQNLSFQQKRFLMNLTFVMCYSLIFNLIYGLLPLNDGGDGMRIWEDGLGFSDEALSILRGVTTIGYLSCVCWLVKSFYESRKALANQTIKESQSVGSNIDNE